LVLAKIHYLNVIVVMFQLVLGADSYSDFMKHPVKRALFCKYAGEWFRKKLQYPGSDLRTKCLNAI